MKKALKMKMKMEVMKRKIKMKLEKTKKRNRKRNNDEQSIRKPHYDHTARLILLNVYVRLKP